MENTFQNARISTTPLSASAIIIKSFLDISLGGAFNANKWEKRIRQFGSEIR